MLMPRDLITRITDIVRQEQQQQLTNQTNNSVDSSTGLNYQFMYKQLESAIEEIMIEYPNDPIVNKLKDKVINNLRPILQIIVNDPNNNFNQ